MLVITSYVPALEGKVVDMIIRRCLELDVEIVIEDRCEGLPIVQIRPASENLQDLEDEEFNQEPLAEFKESQMNSSFGTRGP